MPALVSEVISGSIAEELEISQAQVSRLEKKAINQLKKVLK